MTITAMVPPLTDGRPGDAPTGLGKTLVHMITSPVKALVPPWSWKAAAFTTTFRGLTFFATNLKAGEHVALRAMWVEAVYAVFAGGLAGAISQQLRRTNRYWRRFL